MDKRRITTAAAELARRVGEQASSIQPVRLGAELDKPRERCPDCGAEKPRLLGVMDFPMESEKGVAQAMADGADLYECMACKKRWAVMRVARTGTGTAPPTPKGPTQRKGDGRRVRRAIEARDRKAIEKNLKLAAREPWEAKAGAAPAAPAIDPVKARKARNARKAAKRGGAR